MVTIRAYLPGKLKYFLMWPLQEIFQNAQGNVELYHLFAHGVKEEINARSLF